MTNLLSQVTPLTKGLLWFTGGEITPEKSFYKDVDYLLNGLLTATLSSSPKSASHVLVSENFGQTFYVMVGTEVTDKELQSFFDLIKTQLSEENDILFIDESEMFTKVQKSAPVEIKNRMRLIQ